MERNKTIESAQTILGACYALIVAIGKLTNDNITRLSDIENDPTLNDAFKSDKSSKITYETEKAINKLFDDIKQNNVELLRITNELCNDITVFDDTALINLLYVAKTLMPDKDNTDVVKILVRRYTGNFGALNLIGTVIPSEKDRREIDRHILNDEIFEGITAKIDTLIYGINYEDLQSVLIALNRIIKYYDEISSYFGYTVNDANIDEIKNKAIELEIKKALNG